MQKARILIVIAISGFVILTSSGVAGAIGFTYVDRESQATNGGTLPITYIVSIPDAGGTGTLRVTGGNSDWTLNWVEFKLGGVRLNKSPTF